MDLFSLSLLQLGDIHYPDNRGRRHTDEKDALFPQHVIGRLAPKPLQAVIREASRLAEDLDGILICGDLTSQGNLAEYRDCVLFLHRALALAGRSPDAVHVVPGNHDINRDLCSTSGHDFENKFGPLAKAWSDVDLPVLATQTPRVSALKTDKGAQAHIFSLNSCIGCGEFRLQPEAIRSQLKQHSEGMSHADAFALVGERLDTPAFQDEDLLNVKDAIRSLSPSSQPVILTHHNILPQAMPRIELYTELLNSGVFRSRFTDLARPIIYCHGHIHDDPIEIIQKAGSPARIVSIAAPPITSGFNVIKIFYSKERKPIGCEILPYRLQRDGSVSPARSVRVPLYSSHFSAFETVFTEDLRGYLASVPSNSTRFADILLTVREAAETHTHNLTLARALKEAEWLGIVEIRNRNEDTCHWQIRRKVI